MTKPVLELHPDVSDLPLIASVSGGKDSTAMILALRESGLDARFVFADTGWEDPVTLEYLDLLRARLSITIDVVGRPGGMIQGIVEQAYFPTGRNRWCTRLLKLEPLRAYHDQFNDGDTVSVIGVRAEESAKRAQLAEWVDEPAGPRRWGGWIWRPLLRWTVDDVLRIHHRHAVPVNPLYRDGWNRVGCMPCVNATKSDLRLLATHRPERVEQIRNMEREVEQIRAERNRNDPGRYGDTRASFFATGIDSAVAWSRTERGGKQLPMFPDEPRSGCLLWGLCDAGNE